MSLMALPLFSSHEDIVAATAALVLGASLETLMGKCAEAMNNGTAVTRAMLALVAAGFGVGR